MLEEWFIEFNKRVFKGELPMVEVRYARLEWQGTAGYFHHADRMIEIGDHLTAPKQRAALLHEMVHLWQSCNGYATNHGKQFKEWKATCLRITGLRI